MQATECIYFVDLSSSAKLNRNQTFAYISSREMELRNRSLVPRGVNVWARFVPTLIQGESRKTNIFKTLRAPPQFAVELEEASL